MQFVLGSELFYLTCITGCAVLAGGIIYKEQTAQTESSRLLASFLVLATTLVFIPAVMTSIPAPAEHLKSEFPVLALGISVVLLLLCGFYLLFQLKTHAELFGSVDSDAVEGDQDAEPNLTHGSFRNYLDCRRTVQYLHLLSCDKHRANTPSDATYLKLCRIRPSPSLPGPT
jgi:calcium/proton exchanger cax